MTELRRWESKFETKSRIKCAGIDFKLFWKPSIWIFVTGACSVLNHAFTYCGPARDYSLTVFSSNIPPNVSFHCCRNVLHWPLFTGVRKLEKKSTHTMRPARNVFCVEISPWLPQHEHSGRAQRYDTTEARIVRLLGGVLQQNVHG